VNKENRSLKGILAAIFLPLLAAGCGPVATTSSRGAPTTGAATPVALLVPAASLTGRLAQYLPALSRNPDKELAELACRVGGRDVNLPATIIDPDRVNRMTGRWVGLSQYRLIIGVTTWQAHGPIEMRLTVRPPSEGSDSLRVDSDWSPVPGLQGSTARSSRDVQINFHGPFAVSTGGETLTVFWPEATSDGPIIRGATLGGRQIDGSRICYQRIYWPAQ